MVSTGVVKDYRDEEGIQRRVLLPNEYTPLSEGIPISLDVERLYDHMPIAFKVKFTDELWAVGMIEPSDFLKPGAADKIRAALLAVIKRDVFDIQALAKESKHGQQR